MRICSSCKETKPKEAFSLGRRIYWCKDCYSAYAKRNREHKNKQSNCWQKANRDKVAFQQMRYRNQKTQAMPVWANEQEIRAFYAEAKRVTQATGTQHEVDHIIPLKSPLVCGLHTPINLRVISKAENRSKSNHLYKEF